MTSRTFDQIIADQLTECAFIRVSKGIDYTDENDRLSNFKDVGRLLGVDPKIIWAVYFLKHITAIANYCGRGRVESEPITGRISDAINYLLLLRGLIEEETGTCASDDTTTRMLAAAGIQLPLPL